MVAFLVVMTVLYEIYDSRKVSDDVACAKCRHRKEHRHGNCQECLREDVRGKLALVVPCTRFGRQVPTSST